MLTFIQVNMNQHSKSYFFIISSLSSLRLFCFSIIYSTEFKMKFSQEMITSITGSMFLPLLYKSRDTFFQMEHERPLEKMWQKHKKKIISDVWRLLNRYLRLISRNSAWHSPWETWNRISVYLTLLLCYNKKIFLVSLPNVVTNPITSMRKVTLQAIPAEIETRWSRAWLQQQQNPLTSTAHCIYRLF